MGLREKALRFKQEAQLQNTPLDTIPGPAETPPAISEESPNSPKMASAKTATASEDAKDFASELKDTGVLHKEAHGSEQESNLLEMAYEILSTRELPLAYDVSFLAVIQVLRERQAALWLAKGDHLELVASRNIDQNEISYLALPEPLASAPGGEVVGPRAWDESWDKVVSQVEALLPIQHEGRLQGVVAVAQIPEITSPIRGLLQIIGYALHRNKDQEGPGESASFDTEEASQSDFFQSNFFQSDFFQWVESFINERMARDAHLVAVPLTLQNIKRLQALFGTERAAQAIKITKELIWSELSANDRFLRVGYNKFLLIFHEGHRADARINKIFSDLRSWQAGPDFRLLPSYEILVSQRDFANGGDLLSLL